MQTLEANERAADLYWLAFLLTGNPEPSRDLALEAVALESQDCAAGVSPFFRSWMLGWSRRVVIAKALAAIREDLAESARRIVSKGILKLALPPRNWVLSRGTTKLQLERALLAIDVFPRCAVLLSVFEGISLEDAAVLLDGDRELIADARMTGLRELTRNLAEMQGWKSTSPGSYVMTSEMQHA